MTYQLKNCLTNLHSYKECLGYPNRVLIGSSKKFGNIELTRYDSFSVQWHGSGGWRDTMQNWKITKIQTEGNNLFVIQYQDDEINHFIYYDENFNIVKETRYMDNGCQLLKINVIADDEIICMRRDKLVHVNMKTKTTRTIFSGGYDWIFLVDSNRDISVVYPYETSDVGKVACIRRFAFKDNYDKTIFDDHLGPSSGLLSYNNEVYVYLLNPIIVNHYNVLKKRIIDAYHDKKIDSHYVTSMTSTGITTDLWKYSFGIWLNSIALYELPEDQIYKINLLTNRSEIFMGNNNYHFSCVIENYQRWSKRMTDFLGNLTCIEKMSIDLLLMILSYIKN